MREEPPPTKSRRTVQAFEVGSHTLELSNLAKVMYPATGFRKEDVLRYYADLAPHLLPHLRGRPLTLKRYPDGVEGFFFYQKEAPAHRPTWLGTTKVWSDVRGGDITYCRAEDLESLVWLANTGNLEIHSFLHRAQDLARPDSLVFDLDPGPPADALACCAVALLIRDMFRSEGLQAFPKVSGGKGMQMHVPLHTAVTYDQTKGFARDLAREMEAEHPKLVTSLMRKDLRKGKVFIDWSQNDQHKTTVSVYSLRAQPTPTVSVPVSWDEVEDAAARGDLKALKFSPVDAVDRARRLGDLYKPVLTLRQKLAPASGREDESEMGSAPAQGMASEAASHGAAAQEKERQPKASSKRPGRRPPNPRATKGRR